MSDVVLKFWRTPDLLLESAWKTLAGEKVQYLEDFDESKEGFVVDLGQMEAIMKEGLVEGFREDRFDQIPTRPAWLDEDKLRRGQRFANEFLAGVSYSQMISLYILFADPEGLKTLIATDRSSTEFSAFKRYLSTSVRIWKWYDADLLDKNSEATKSLRSVWHLHRAAYREFNSLSQQEMDERTDLKKKYKVNSSLCPAMGRQLREMNFIPELLASHQEGRLKLNQVEMSFTLFSFVGLVCLYPSRFGVRTTAEDMEGFLHMWRYVAYRLGVREERNVCVGSLTEIRNRMYFLMEFGFKPLFRQLTTSWEHMSRAATSGISRYSPPTTLEENLVFLFDLLRMECPMLRTPWTEFKLAASKTLNWLLAALPHFRRLVNYLIKRKVLAIHADLISHAAKNAKYIPDH